MTACRDCGRPIRWAVTRKGNRMPIDPTPNDGGNIRFTGQFLMGGAELIDVVRAGQGTHQPHFASCPGRSKPRP